MVLFTVLYVYTSSCAAGILLGLEPRIFTLCWKSKCVNFTLQDVILQHKLEFFNTSKL